MTGVNKKWWKTPWGIIATLILLLIILFAGYFTVEFVKYYRGIRRGDLMRLPQFERQLTKAAKLPAPTKGNAPLAVSGNPSFGPIEASLTIVEFADFGCPYSKSVANGVRELMTKYGDRVRFVFRNFPLEDIHPGATLAAVAATCSNEQGKFWAMHDKLFSAVAPFTNENLIQYGREVGLDIPRFNRCINGQSARRMIEQDAQDGAALGVFGTPTFFINGIKIDGAIPSDILERLIVNFE